MPVITGINNKLRRFFFSYPLVKKFVVFPAVASGTGYDKIFRSVRSASTKRDNVVNMKLMFPPSYLALAVIAFALLLGILRLNILSGMCACGLFLASVVVAFSCIQGVPVIQAALLVGGFSYGFSALTTLTGFYHFSPMFGSIVLSGIRSSLFFMAVVPLLRVYSMIFSVYLVLLSIILLPFFFMLFLPLCEVFFFLFCVLSMPRSISCTRAVFTFASKFLPIFIEESQGESLSTKAALFALRGVKGYTGIHGRRSFLSSRLRMFAASLGHHIITPAFYHKTASEATLYPFYRPASNFLEA